MIEEFEAATGMMDEGEGLAQSGGDFVVMTLEVDGVVVLDAPGAAQGEVQIEQRGWRGGTPCSLRHAAARCARA